MKIRDVLDTGKRTLSFEFFPPKSDQGVAALLKTAEELKLYRPTYVSVTYGAGGSTRDRTIDVAIRIKREIGLEPMCHVTCVSQTTEEVDSVLVRLEEEGIGNVLGLRGDHPRDQEHFIPVAGGFHYAVDLITYIRENFDFGVAAACFPEGHVDSLNLTTDTEYLKQKVDAGADFLVTQLFYDNADFFNLRERAERAGIKVPIIGGILPILGTSQIRRFAAFCGAKIPPALNEQLEKYADNDDIVQELGIEYAMRQVEELWENGVAGVHFYTLNRSYSTSRVIDGLKLSTD